MSPTEFDLRAALREGEGDGPDVDGVIAHGRARHAQRRVRALSTAAAVVVVVCAAAGGAVLWNTGGSGGHDNASNAAAGGQAYSSRSSDANGKLAQPVRPASGATKSDQRNAAARPATQCPPTVPSDLVPVGGNQAKSGSSGPLFTKPVQRVVVCSYGTPSQAQGRIPVTAARLELSGDRARRLVASLNNAAKVGTTVPCPSSATTDRHELAIIGIAADGTRAATVTATLTNPACNVQVSNGTAIRYQWAPPPDLQPVLVTLTPRIAGAPETIPNHTPSGKVHGSPLSS
jgi:hypothetical protein